MTLTKIELAKNLFNTLNISEINAKHLVETFFEEIRASLEQGQQIRLSGFGNFNLRDKAERPGRNPKTGKDVPITARRVVTFRAGVKLKERVEKYTGPATAKIEKESKAKKHPSKKSKKF